MTLLIKPINQFTIAKTDTPNGSYFGFDWWDGTVWQTVKILAEDLATALGTPNFANANLQADANRSHDMNEFNLLIGKIKELKFETTLAPSSGEPAIQLKGFGSAGDALVLNMTCTAGDILQLFGDKSSKFFGKLGVGTNPTSAQLTVDAGVDPVGVSSTGSTQGVSGLSTAGMGGYFEGANGIEAYSTGAGIAVRGESFSGLGGSFKGGVLVQPYGGAASLDGSALFEVNSTTKGVLIPRMTTTQRDAISSPATGLQIFNTTTNRLEFYTGSYWAGETKLLPIQHTSWSPTDGQTVAFGSNPFIPVQASISPAPFEIVMRGNGVIRGCDFDSYASGVAGESNAWSLYVRHNGTDYLVQTVSSASAVRKFTNQSLNIPYVDGDIVRMIFVNPSWPTNNPTNVAGSGSLKLQ